MRGAGEGARHPEGHALLVLAVRWLHTCAGLLRASSDSRRWGRGGGCTAHAFSLTHAAVMLPPWSICKSSEGTVS